MTSKVTRHVMVDIETLSTEKNAVVLSIGAVEFDPFTGKILAEFYRPLKLSSQSKRHVSASTVQWWAKQCEKNLDNVGFLAGLDENGWDVTEALTMLGVFIAGADEAGQDVDVNVWACDPDFDLDILATLYADFGMKTPWKYYETRSVRTIRTMGKQFNLETPKLEASHNALDDCVRQAKQVSYVYSSFLKDGA